jgi:hypothetical protein
MHAIDKPSRRQTSQDIDPLAQLYSALEPETASHVVDISLGVELDSSQVLYLATANGLRNLDSALLSRFEVIQVGLPSPDERKESAKRVVESALARLGVQFAVTVSPRRRRAAGGVRSINTSTDATTFVSRAIVQGHSTRRREGCCDGGRRRAVSTERGGLRGCAGLSRPVREPPVR